MKDTDAAWAAGFLDGEGTFAVTMDANGGINIRVTATQVVEAPLTKLQELFGGNIYYIPATRPNHRDTYRWQLSKTSDVEAFLNAVAPYLVVKALHVILQRKALRFAKANNTGISEDMLRERIAVCEEVRRLNRVGL
jgi:hypothetical protein